MTGASMRARESGAALLSVLLLVTLMSIAAVMVAELTVRSIGRAKAADDRARIAWYTVGAEELGRAFADRLRTATNGRLTDVTPGLDMPVTFTPPGGVITLRARDASNCFNVNSFATDEESRSANPPDRIEATYQDMLVALGVPEVEAEALRDALADWIDADIRPRPAGVEDSYYAGLRAPYRTSGQFMVERSELRPVLGYSPEVLARLGDLICVRPSIELGPFNLNTLRPQDAPLLVAAFSRQIGVEQAVQMIEERPLGGWPTLDEFLRDETIQAVAPELRRTDLLAVEASHLWIDADVRFRDGQDKVRILYAIQNGESAILSREYGER